MIPIAPAYPKVTEADVLAAIDRASIRQLAQALDGGAFQGQHGRDGFRCPDAGHWSAKILDAWRWECAQCAGQLFTTTSGHRTRLALARHVADRFEACVSLVRIVGKGRS